MNRHIEQWKHNREFISTIDIAYPDWIVTAIFYTALHAVDVLLIHDQESIVSHSTRNGVLINTNRYQNIWKHYSQLYSLSQTVRYMAEPTKWVKIEDIETQVIKGLLYPIERSVFKLSKVQAECKPIVIKVDNDGR